jgi:hypothetical protein
MTVLRDFLLQVFFHESSSPKLLQIMLGSFKIFLKIHGDIRTTGSTTPVANLPLVSMTSVANFGAGTTGFVNTGSKLPLVSATPVVNNGIC